MKITKQFASEFAAEWVNAWNNHEIDAIMKHYSDDVVFSSPFILKTKINKTGTLHGKAELRNYFEKALAKNTDLQFELKHTMAGIKSITLIYVRKKTMLATETMILNEAGKIAEGLSHYPVEDIYELLNSEE